MAAAVCRLHENVLLDIGGPSADDGFYYDFDLSTRLSPEDLPAIEKEMARLIAEDLPFERIEMGREEARRELEQRGQRYKLERLADIPAGEPITFYRCGDFMDLCRGPHAERTGDVKAFALLSVAGSYYRGLETNPMLQRVYGAAFASKAGLDEHLRRLEEARKRDHRRLGRELDLFSITDDVGPGLVHWHPKGARVRCLIEDFWRREHFAEGYDLLYTPHIGRSGLWETSGHLGFYRESMYSPMEIDSGQYFIKPMNCPFHIQIYKSGKRSYRELPLRWAELGTVYRYEKAGVLHGLFRVRGFTQDDAHIFCTEAQVEDEVYDILQLADHIMKTFGFEYTAEISTRPEKSIGSDDMWEHATQALKNAITRFGLDYEINEGDGAFYGPKIDIKVKDAIGRTWQCSTVQVDFNFPERFDLTYRTAENTEERPYQLHRAIFGSIVSGRT